MWLKAALLALWAVSLNASDKIEAQRYLADVQYLSSQGMKGRASGGPELDKAARFIEKEFRKAGLRPLGGGSYFQPFAVSVKASMGPRNRFTYTLAGTRTELKSGQGFIPFGFSGAGVAQGPVVFAGYGITAPEYNYDDYAGVDVRGKVVLLLRHEPQEFDAASVFEGRVYTEHSQLFSKAINARAHGAVAVLHVNDTANHGSDPMEEFVSLPGPGNPGLPFIQVASKHVEKWFLDAGRNFKTIQEEIDRSLQPQSFALPDHLTVDMEADVHHTSRNIFNVVGYLPGTTDEHIVIGAHYDHLGLGEQYSLAPEKAGTIHPGADDNASGVAGMLALARHFSGKPRPVRGIVFMAFAGEELGLLGSSHYVNHPLLPLPRATLMINMDMVGRIRDGKVMVGGAPAHTPFRRLLDALGPRYGLDLDLSDTSVYGSSDHTSFKAKGVPALFFFSGLHDDYHRPTDTWDKISADSTVRLLKLIAELASIVTSPSSKPQFAGAAKLDASDPAPASTTAPL
jgi:Peptidase family M28/PA domain